MDNNVKLIKMNAYQPLAKMAVSAKIYLQDFNVTARQDFSASTAKSPQTIALHHLVTTPELAR